MIFRCVLLFVTITHFDEHDQVSNPKKDDKNKINGKSVDGGYVMTPLA